ncbi:MAG: PD-(D/E)XK nuclease family protein [Alphaproteobacteria bacterium]|nr:PD-(D/E)XK nuclease family protein [Alphaproteobacteria bacterium]
MGLNNNIFCASNPAKILDALWRIMVESDVDIQNMLIFLPSRRAVRTVERMIVEKIGHAAILPRLVSLGEGIDDESDDDIVAVSDLERVVAMTYILTGVPGVGGISAAIPIARTLVTMQDYLENSGIDISSVDWNNLVDARYAAHFRDKAQILSIISQVSYKIFLGQPSETKVRNSAVYAWCDYVKKMPVDNSLIIVCGSTASVPTTRDLMSEIAKLPNGRIILSGKISGRTADFELDTNPYNSEYKFLSGIGLSVDDVRVIDVGLSCIDFMNAAFSNVYSDFSNCDLSNCHLIETSRESEEASVVAELAVRAVDAKKTVLVITPDAAGNQRLQSEFMRRGIVADFSGGTLGTSTPAGRAILNLFDDWIENNSGDFSEIYASEQFDLFNAVSEIVEKYHDIFVPQFIDDDNASIQVWVAIKKLSECLNVQKIRVNLSDARAFIADALSGVRVRGVMNDSASVVVLGTIESRMQTADVVILTGLNEGMFPALGYENPWLPRKIANEIGLPSPNHKVSLMALDFMNLSCGPCVYWTRSRVSGGTVTQESRFLSRVKVARGTFDAESATEVLNSVRARDSVDFCSLDYSDPVPPADWSNVYVTELELLIHNPYAFYVRHILRLRVLDDYWVGPDARDFGNLVHGVLENEHAGVSEMDLIAQMDARAADILGRNSLLFHFWHRRFVEIAPVAVRMLNATSSAKTEVEGRIQIAGRTVCARADRIWDNGVLDIKTGAAPSRSQLVNGNMPQLPLEALMLKSGGFAMYSACENPIIQFLQLRSGDARIIEYDMDTTADMMRAANDKIVELFNMYSAGGMPYKYLRTGDAKYKIYDDFARADERD